MTVDPKDQTTETWLADYAAAEGAPVHDQKSRQVTAHLATRPQELTGEFRYVEHRTTTRGRLVLDFVHVDTGEIACRFFNVDIQSPRGGRKYRAGLGGQFTTRPGHLFRQFWIHAIGTPPRRWSRTHTEMHRLKGITFKGIAVRQDAYWKLDKIRKC